MNTAIDATVAIPNTIGAVRLASASLSLGSPPVKSIARPNQAA